MPRPVSAQATYMPGLDGVRAVAVAVVLGYHLGVPFLPGGLLGVGMFFTLSGFLITFVLMRTWDERGDLDLATFWLRRARRLLPAVILLLLVVVVATALVAPDELGSRVVESIAAFFYVSNWTTIASDDSYFEAFAGPGPLDHLWSLAVEEQFYLVWPLLLLALLTWQRRRVPRVALLTLVLAAASFAWMLVVARVGFDNTRAYEGTDTRAGGLLIGAALAMIWRPDRLSRDVVESARWVIDSIGVAAGAVLIWLVVTTDPFSLSLYRGGLLALSIATALLVAVVVHPASRLGELMGSAPLVWVGERSYGIYLWHLPVIAFTPDTVLGDEPVLLGTLQVVVSVGLAALSWTAVEDPIRRHGLLGAIRAARASRSGGDRSSPAVPLAALARGAAVVTVVGVAVLAVLPVIGGTARSSATTTAAEPNVVTDDDGGAGTDPAVAGDGDPDGAPADGGATTDPATGGAGDPVGSAAPEPVAPVAAGDPTTSCDEVVHIGDSTSRGLFNPDQLPEPETRIDARYEQVGVTTVIDQVAPAQSIVETYDGQPNADDRVAGLVADGYDGCWVFALGMQDSANQAVGGVVPLGDRIDTLMEHVGDAPALWTTGLALEQDGPWSDPEIRKWNEAVVEACDRWPTMRVYDWRSEAVEEWYDSDGIHFNAAGDVERARRIATALAVAFPDSGTAAPGCLVRTA
ncbi:acyltransferase family protein [Ilumatobacter sp.]|uniref:acyltransferase family protein n=1 Tax=Ilumatobacter sp. TaxID=1967498 RepID=UPI003B5255AB